VRYHPEAPGHSYLGQTTTEPTSGQDQVDNEDSLLFYEIETDDGEVSVFPASRGSQAASTVTTADVVGGPLQPNK
jgi:hypothetical protein